VRKLEKDFYVLELQHVPRESNSAADALSVSASTQAPVPEGVLQRRLLKPSAQPAELGEGGRTSTSKLAVPAALHPWCPPRVVCSLRRHHWSFITAYKSIINTHISAIIHRIDTTIHKSFRIHRSTQFTEAIMDTHVPTTNL
jgi:hypothetical protein